MSDLHLPTSYQGQAGFFENDIAIVVLSNSIKMSNKVLPACMDWKTKFPFIKEGINGTVIDLHVN